MRKFRTEHAAELRAKAEHKRLMSLKLSRGSRHPTVFMYELVDESGQVFDIVISYESEPPAGAIRSPFLPSIPISARLARMLRDSRLKQLASWRINRE
jgi:hypothetical protein